MRDVVAKAVCHEGKQGWQIEGQHDAHMGATCAECFEPGIPGREMEDCLKNLHIGKSNYRKVDIPLKKQSNHK
jgi:hypothetical protein